MQRTKVLTWRWAEEAARAYLSVNVHCQWEILTHWIFS